MRLEPGPYAPIPGEILADGGPSGRRRCWWRNHDVRDLTRLHKAHLLSGELFEVTRIVQTIESLLQSEVLSTQGRQPYLLGIYASPLFVCLPGRSERQDRQAADQCSDEGCSKSQSERDCHLGKEPEPAYRAVLPSNSSIRSNWLYLATRSERAGAPVLI